MPLFFAGFGNLPVQGRCCRNFELIVSCFFFCRVGPVGGDPEVPDRLRRRRGSACTASPRHSDESTQWRGDAFGINHLFFCLSVVVDRCSLVRRLPSKRDIFGGMQIFAYLRAFLFQIVHVFWTARGCVDGLVSMVRSGPRWCFGITLSMWDLQDTPQER